MEARDAETLAGQKASSDTTVAGLVGKVTDNCNDVTALKPEDSEQKQAAVAAVSDWFKPLEKEGSTVIEVECGTNKALLYIQRLGQGSKGACVRFQDAWLTPNEFQFVSGRETAKDWKRSIKHNGKSIKLLFSKGVLAADDSPPKKSKKAKAARAETEHKSDAGHVTAPEYQAFSKPLSAPVFPGMDLSFEDGGGDAKGDVTAEHQGSEKENRDSNLPAGSVKALSSSFLLEGKLSSAPKQADSAAADHTPRTDSPAASQSVIDSIIGSVVTSSLRPAQPVTSEEERSPSVDSASSRSQSSPGGAARHTDNRHSPLSKEWTNKNTAGVYSGDWTPQDSTSHSQDDLSDAKKHTIEYKPSQKHAASSNKRRRSSKKLPVSNASPAEEVVMKKQKTDATLKPDLASGMPGFNPLLYMPWAAGGLYGAAGGMFNPYVAATNSKLYEKYLQNLSLAAAASEKRAHREKESHVSPVTSEGSNCGGAAAEKTDALDLSVRRTDAAVTHDLGHRGVDLKVPVSPSRSVTSSQGAESPRRMPESPSAGSKLLDSPSYFARLGHITAASGASPNRTVTSEGGFSPYKTSGGDCARIRRDALARIEAWSVEKVGQYLRSNPETAEFAPAFEEHLISGRSLMFLTTEDMTRTMRIKLGPALSLKAAIRTLVGQCAHCDHCLHCHRAGARD